MVSWPSDEGSQCSLRQLPWQSLLARLFIGDYFGIMSSFRSQALETNKSGACSNFHSFGKPQTPLFPKSPNNYK
eukprot:5655526-Amphidinium_carterae.1